jgi:hypothetical protein
VQLLGDRHEVPEKPRVQLVRHPPHLTRYGLTL